MKGKAIEALSGCPLCGSPGRQYGVGEGRVSRHFPVVCTNVDSEGVHCRLVNIPLPLDVWEAFNRPPWFGPEGNAFERLRAGDCPNCEGQLMAEHWKGLTVARTWWVITCNTCHLQGKAIDRMDVIRKLVKAFEGEGQTVECPGCHATLKPTRYDGPAPEEFRWSVTCFRCALSGHGPTPAEAIREFQRDSRRNLWLKDEYHRKKDCQGMDEGEDGERA